MFSQGQETILFKHHMELIFKNYLQNISNKHSVKNPLNYSRRNFTCKSFELLVYICFR